MAEPLSLIQGTDRRRQGGGVEREGWREDRKWLERWVGPAIPDFTGF